MRTHFTLSISFLVIFFLVVQVSAQYNLEDSYYVSKETFLKKGDKRLREMIPGERLYPQEIKSHGGMHWFKVSMDGNEGWIGEDKLIYIPQRYDPEYRGYYDKVFTICADKLAKYSERISTTFVTTTVSTGVDFMNQPTFTTITTPVSTDNTPDFPKDKQSIIDDINNVLTYRHPRKFDAYVEALQELLPVLNSADTLSDDLIASFAKVLKLRVDLTSSHNTIQSYLADKDFTLVISPKYIPFDLRVGSKGIEFEVVPKLDFDLVSLSLDVSSRKIKGSTYLTVVSESDKVVYFLCGEGAILNFEENDGFVISNPTEGELVLTFK
jgi:hypothetical protein